MFVLQRSPQRHAMFTPRSIETSQVIYSKKCLREKFMHRRNCIVEEMLFKFQEKGISCKNHNAARKDMRCTPQCQGKKKRSPQRHTMCILCTPQCQEKTTTQSAKTHDVYSMQFYNGRITTQPAKTCVAPHSAETNTTRSAKTHDVYSMQCYYV